ncbi:MAG: hypothetical protein SPE75_07565 [Prevotella sp.]|nr:hypothetical protein [Prevotella sp.]
MIKTMRKGWVLAVALLWGSSVMGQTNEPLTEAYSQETYTCVHDAATLEDGDVVVIANAGYGYALGKQQNTNNRQGVKVEIVDEQLTPNEEVQLITLKKHDDTWALGVGDNQWLCATGTSSTQLKTTSKMNEYALANISIEAASGNACIDFTGPHAKNMVMRFSHTSKVFNCYTSLTSVDSLQIYRRTRIIPSLTLTDDGTDLTPVITKAKGATVQRVTLNRHFVADGGWHTLCLPFNLTAQDIKEMMGGAEVAEFYAVTMEADGALTLGFRPVTHTLAGHPYLVRMARQVEQCVFENKLIASAQPVPVTLTTADGSEYTFHGIYAPTRLQGTDYRFLRSDGASFAVPNGEGKVDATRAYFVFSSSIESAQCVFLPATSGIDAPDAVGSTSLRQGARSNIAYDLMGRRLFTTKQQKGIVVVNGKKMWLK